MPLTTKLSYSEKREMLCQQLRQQREVLARQLIHTIEANNTYPRSLTMRFLTQQSGAKVVAEVATVLIGARFFKSIGKAFTLVKILKTMATKSKS